jgi:flavin-dependent thymidylate synthase
MHTLYTKITYKRRMHMKVELITHTPDALELLLLTKGVRLAGEEQSLEAIKSWPLEQKLEHLAYMRDTIKSSWEFVEYVFKVSGVTRAFTHQFVRTRPNSYAQEAQRVVDLSSATFLTPPALSHEDGAMFNEIVSASIRGYKDLRGKGIAPQDARGVVPTNIHTSIMAKINLRSMSSMAEVRLCTRTQGEYQDVFRLMREEVLRVHPWAEDFIQVWCAEHGTCQFPRYKECPIQKFTYHGTGDNVHQKVLSGIKRQFWSVRHEANPVAFKGSSQTREKI